MKKHLILFVVILATALSAKSYAQSGQEYIIDSEDSVQYVDKVFEYPGGRDALYEDISRNFKIPRKAKKDKVQGIILLQITIDSTEYASGKILKGVREDVDNAALKMVTKLKRSVPTTQKGKNVSTTVQLPLKINLE